MTMSVSSPKLVCKLWFERRQEVTTGNRRLRSAFSTDYRHLDRYLPKVVTKSVSFHLQIKLKTFDEEKAKKSVS